MSDKILFKTLQKLLSKVLTNKVFQYISSRYLTYFIQFINSLLIAFYLGPYYLGIWGFINLVLQYFTQLNLGVNQSFNALGAIHKKDEAYVSTLIGNTILCLIAVSCLGIVFLSANYYFELGIWDKYGLEKYFLYVIIIVILNYFTPTFQILYRIYGDVISIAISQSLLPIVTFLALIFFQENITIQKLINALLLGSFFSLVILFFRIPIKINLSLDFSLVKKILTKGFYLFVYSSCFYFILLSTKTLVSDNYTVEEFGLFIFAFSLGNAILLFLKSFVFLIFPKVINRLAHSKTEEIMIILQKARQDYTTLSHLLGYTVILMFPVVIYFLPKYADAVISFNLIVASLIAYTHTFGFQELFIAKGKEKLLGAIAFVSLFVNIAIGLLLIFLLEVKFSLVIISTLIAYLVFLGLLVYMSNKVILKSNLSFVKLLKIAFPIKLFIPFSLCVIISLLEPSYLFYLIPFVIYILLNRNNLLNIKKTMIKILNKPDIINI